MIGISAENEQWGTEEPKGATEHPPSSPAHWWSCWPDGGTLKPDMRKHAASVQKEVCAGPGMGVMLKSVQKLNYYFYKRALL